MREATFSLAALLHLAAELHDQAVLFCQSPMSLPSMNCLADSTAGGIVRAS
jgi:hypothetical protein